MKTLILALSLLLLVGCKSFESNVLHTLALSKIAVTASTEAYGQKARITPIPVEDQIKAAKIFEEWKQVSLATAEALRVYMLVKAQVGADQATSEQLKVAKKAVTDNLTATTKLQLEIK